MTGSFWPISAGDNRLKTAKSCPLIPIPVYHATPTAAKRAIGPKPSRYRQ